MLFMLFVPGSTRWIYNTAFPRFYRVKNGKERLTMMNIICTRWRTSMVLKMCIFSVINHPLNCEKELHGKFCVQTQWRYVWARIWVQKFSMPAGEHSDVRICNSCNESVRGLFMIALQTKETNYRNMCRKEVWKWKILNPTRNISKLITTVHWIITGTRST